MGRGASCLGLFCCLTVPRHSLPSLRLQGEQAGVECSVRKIAALLTALALGVASATDIPASEIQRINSLQLDLRSIVANAWKQIYTYPTKKSAIPQAICVGFYNEVAAFHNDKLMAWSNQSKYTSTTEGRTLDRMFSSAFDLADACEYKDSVGIIEFKMYKELFDRDVAFLEYVLASRK